MAGVEETKRQQRKLRRIKIHHGAPRRAIRYQPAVLRWRNTISTIRKRACGERADPVRSRRSHQEPRSRKLRHICMRAYMHYATCTTCWFRLGDRSIRRVVVHACCRRFLELFAPRERDSETLSRTSYRRIRDSCRLRASESENTERIVSRLGHAAANAAPETPLASRSSICLDGVRSECSMRLRYLFRDVKLTFRLNVNSKIGWPVLPVQQISFAYLTRALRIFVRRIKFSLNVNRLDGWCPVHSGFFDPTKL